VLEHAAAAVDQVHRDPDAGVYVADVLLLGVQGVQVPDAGGQQVAQPALQGRLEPFAHLFRAEVAGGAGVVEHVAVEVVGEHGQAVGADLLQQPTHRRDRAQAPFPVLGQARVPAGGLGGGGRSYGGGSG